MHGWQHVNTDWVTFEPVDSAFKRVPKREVSHTVLVSNLANRLQPVLRYDLDDSVVERTDPCPRAATRSRRSGCKDAPLIWCASHTGRSGRQSAADGVLRPA